MPEERIQKLLAQAGVASRRASEDLIRQGRVTVNGQVAQLGDKADPTRDTIQVDGETVELETAGPVYVVLYKPVGVVSAASAQQQEERPTVRDLVPLEGRLYPVGRLDADSEGLILLTNDGGLTQRLTHPRYGHKKTYEVLVRGHPNEAVLEQWRAGVELDDGKTPPCEVRVQRRVAGGTWLEIVMSQGRKRQIRRTAVALGLHVKRLIRIRLGPLSLKGLEPGEWRHADREEAAALRRIARGQGRGQGRGGGRGQQPRRPPEPAGERPRKSKRGKRETR